MVTDPKSDKSEVSMLPNLHLILRSQRNQLFTNRLAPKSVYSAEAEYSAYDFIKSKWTNYLLITIIYLIRHKIELIAALLLRIPILYFPAFPWNHSASG